MLVTLALAGLMVVSVAGIAAAGKNKEEACVDNLCFKAGGGFKPKKLSKKKQTPIALIAEGKIKTTDGSHPPALNKVILETDKNGAINVKHYPTCKSRKLQSRDTKAAEKACKKAIIGQGRRPPRSTLAEQNPSHRRTPSCWSSTAASRAARRPSTSTPTSASRSPARDRHHGEDQEAPATAATG